MSRYPADHWNEKFQQEDLWEFKTNPWQHQRFMDVVNLLPKDTKKVLDFGCMEGEFTTYLPYPQESITGIDISSVAIERAKKKLPKARFLAMDIEERSLEEKFDLVICMETLYYAASQEKMRERLIELTENNQLLVLEHVLGNIHDNQVIAEYYHLPYLYDKRIKREITFTRFGEAPPQSYRIDIFRKL